MSIRSRLLSAMVLALGLATPVVWADALDEVKARMKAESQRVENEFTTGRAEAYRLVRNDDPRLVEATERLATLQAMISRDTSLEPKRRQVLAVTLKWDLDKVKEIAAERRKVQIRQEQRIISDAARRETMKNNASKIDSGSSVAKTADSIIESRGRVLADSRDARVEKADRLNRVLGSVDKSAVPEARDYVLPKNWAELSKRRSTGIKMTEKEKDIMRALEKTIDVEYKDNTTLEEAIDHLRKALKIEIVMDKQALKEANVSYETQLSVKMRASTRTVLKRMLADLNLAYVIRDEAVLVTSRERAKEMTTTRTYYIGDLVSVVDVRLPPALTQVMMVDNVNRLIAAVYGRVDGQSWRINNPEASGSVVFEPITMTLIIRQSAEFHFMMAGR